jgi:class 3 adenylate cyclase
VHTSFEPALERPITINVLVALVDQYGFVRYARNRPGIEVMAELNELYALIDRAVESGGGYVIKYMGDAALVVFPEELADTGVVALHQLSLDAREWFLARGRDSGLHVNVHFGEVAMGKMGSVDRLDVIGDTVNLCATLAHKGFTLSQQVFRKLTPEHRQIFRRISQPVVYQPNRDPI